MDRIMKKTTQFIAAALLTVGLSASAFAKEAKEVTLTGEGKCAKCALKKADSCQNVVEVKEGDKTTVYYLTGDVSKGFHKNLCSGSAKVKVSGEHSEKDGKHEIKVTKIEKAS
jgi:precorrin-3B methylase